jgi:putative hydroxymethylpyrimidine transport system permease protein
MRRWLPPVALAVLLLGAWQIAASTGALADALGLESFLVPSPAEIAEALWENRSLLAENAWVTLREVLFGFACAVVAGVAFAVVMHLSGVVLRATYPWLVISQTVPVIVLAPILVVWFGFGIGPKLAIVALVCFFPITVNVLDGLRSVDPEAIKLMKTLYASRRQRFMRLEAPNALPGFFTGAKIAVVFAPIGAIFGEWVGANSGLGHQILQDNAQLEIARTFGAVAVLAAIGIGLFGLLAIAERRVVTWR